MAKRSADTELNHDNWDADDDNEEAGTFSRVSENELKNRVIRKAKRSLDRSAAGNMLQGSSPFAAFSGFKATSSPFGQTKQSGISLTGQSSLNKVAENRVKTENGKTDKESDGSTQEANASTAQSSKATRSVEYYRSLQSLNESVLKWMQLHLAKNAYSDFTPVFNDYKKHLDTLNVTYPIKKKEETVDSKAKGDGFFKAPASVEKKSSESNEKSGFSFKSSQNDETDYGSNFSARTTNTSSFSFGMKLTPTATSSISPMGPASSSKEEEKVPDQKPFQFTASSSKDDKKVPEQKPFQFTFQGAPKSDDSSATKGFSFASAIAASAQNSAAAGNDAEDKDYEPPKNEFVKVSEEDALYSKRCKLFFKKDDAFVDKGVGTLYLKSLEGKTQLLVRADTNLGNILLNIMLGASLPISRTGKNNVLLVCVPNPPVDSKNPDKAIPMLIRVKTAEDADELLDELNKHKSS